jgi:hypothetical protein
MKPDVTAGTSAQEGRRKPRSGLVAPKRGQGLVILIPAQSREDALK